MTIRDDDAAEVTASHGAGPAEVVRLLIVDDHEGVRRGAIRLITTSPEFAVVGEAADGGDAVELAQRLRPDVVLMDVSMPGVDGVEATTLLARLAEAPAVVLFTAWADRKRIAEAVAAGAHGHVLKDAPGPDLLQALHDAAGARRAHSGNRAQVRAGHDVDGTKESCVDVRAEPAIAPPGRRRPPRRSRQARAAGVAAIVLLATAGPAAARQGALPAPVQAAARFVGLPTPPTRLDRARDALVQLEEAIRRGDRAAVAQAVAGLQRRTAVLEPSDQARLAGQLSSTLAEAARVLAPAIPASGPPVPRVDTPVAIPGEDHHDGTGGQGGGGSGSGPPSTATPRDPSSGGGGGVGSAGGGGGGGGSPGGDVGGGGGGSPGGPPSTAGASTAVSPGGSPSGDGGSTDPGGSISGDGGSKGPGPSSGGSGGSDGGGGGGGGGSGPSGR